MITWQLWTILLFVLWIYFLWTRRRFYMLTFKIPGPLGYPLIGMAHKVLRKENILPLIEYYWKNHGSMALTWLGPMPFLFLYDPQLIQDVFTSPYSINKTNTYKSVDDGLGKGLFSLEEARWRKHRRLINPAFGHKVLLSFVPIFNAETAILLKSMDTLAEDGEKNLLPLLKRFSITIAAKTTLENDERDRIDDKLVQDFECVQQTITDMIFSPWLLSKTVRQLLGKEEQYSKARSELRSFVSKLIARKLKNVSTDPTVSQDKNAFPNLATDLLKRGILSTKNVEDESIIGVSGAFESTANTVTYTLMLLSMFPQYQEKAFEEIVTLFPNTGDFEVTYEDTQQMVYLDMIINESMRLIAPFPIIARQTSEDIRLSNGVVLPKGLNIAIDIFHLHRCQKNWGNDAETFNPEHFLPQNVQDKHPYAFMPFSKGIRNCIGFRYALISMKVTLAKLLRNYKFSTSFKFEDIVFVENLSMKLKTMPLMKVQRRH